MFIEAKVAVNVFLVFIISVFLFSISLAFSEDHVDAPVDYVQESVVPALFSAILKEDVELYSKEMKSLLDQPIKNFNKTILFQTNNGDTIFHLMAGVRSHQEFFVKEMKSLKDIFSQNSSAKVAHLTIGGVSISIPNLEDTKLGQSIEDKDAFTFVSLTNNLESADAKEVLKYFHVTTKNDQTIKSFILEHFDMSPLSYLWNKSLSDMESHPDISALFLVKNNQGLLPKDLAYKSDNFFAYTFISDHVKNIGHVFRDNLDKASFGAGAVLGAGLSLGWGSVPYTLEPIGQTLLFKTLEAVGYGYLGGLASNYMTTKCYDVFQKMKVNKLHKKNTRKNSQL